MIYIISNAMKILFDSRILQDVVVGSYGRL